ncbi:hypothetical protein [Brevundimonas guildfordensis]|uniref:Uncharacterized protein n=1 Tax=Brevundimonas guildfordensis TaxID=2762241 RepID=A0ABR8R1C3_9CAUL|nr:hypothetical protein [Brevundimonas guildfordensis]MBD7941568.1 hypothetical protein [Brevundimonas guildfordensis]
MASAPSARLMPGCLIETRIGEEMAVRIALRLTSQGWVIDDQVVAALREEGIGGGEKGWSPVIAGEIDGARRVLRVVDWTGGAGAKPIALGYIAATGLSANIADAIDVGGAVTEQAVLDALGFTPADGADTYTKDEVDAAFDALPAPPTVPTFATVAEVRDGTADGKIIAPKVLADALATVPVTPATATAGLDFSGFINAEIAMTGNLTAGPPSGDLRARRARSTSCRTRRAGGRSPSTPTTSSQPSSAFRPQPTVARRSRIAIRPTARFASPTPPATPRPAG